MEKKIKEATLHSRKPSAIIHSLKYLYDVYEYMFTKENEWNYYFTVILLFFTLYTVIKDALISDYSIFFTDALIFATITTICIVYLIKRTIE